MEWYGVEVSDGILELGIEEPRIGDVEIRFIDRKTGEPSAGATRPEYVSRHLKNVKPGKALHGRMLDDLNDLINTAGWRTPTSPGTPGGTASRAVSWWTPS